MWQGIIFTLFLFTGFTTAINVICNKPRYVVILFQPVTLSCDYSTTATSPPLITWKYKSYCRDPIQAALNPSSADNAIAQSNPNYNPNIECADSARTVRIVASKQTAVTLAKEYQGRQISITNNADLNFAQTAWGDSGVYVCTVGSAQDLSGNGECFTELIVLDWLLVVLVVLGFLLLLLLIGICWCQCCPHTCCCYVRCPCCPERCCCPRALYEAGKMAKSGVPSQYAPTVYAPSMYGQPAYGVGGGAHGMPMLPMPMGHTMAMGPPSNGYGRDYDGASSVGQGSQVPLLQDHDGGGNRSGYRVQADQDGNPTRVLYYMERELANLDPSRPGNTPGKYSRLDGMSEVSSLHDGPDSRNRGRARPPQLTTVYDDVDENMSTISSVSQHIRRDEHRQGADNRGRARSMEHLDDIGRNYRDRDDYPPTRRDGGARGDRRGSDDEWSSSGRGYDRGADDRRRRDYSPDNRPRRGDSFRGVGFQGRRSRSRDDLMDLERDRGRGGRDAYDDSFLKEAMEKKKLGEQQRGRSRERLDSESDRSDRYRGPHGGPPPLPLAPPSGNPDRRGNHSNFPPPPPPYTEDSDSLPSSKKSNLKKNGAVSRESLVV
ncbi:lipolysis-stimulated lipoprotein receptor isoform X3 [Rhinichthys klamathensis goyatoka]|uniref:lipolysis-stimulated lipoprotein receptor isoform X3 n=1 Tax=Rhinichthys klamathensis goyatoka TaxID=3034132 RepID=UPI0024B5C63A|nr:lipolysis-stimulated lipoprotein receptor isoform X3 [Rhinichthys klamathensis goyatoka]